MVAISLLLVLTQQSLGWSHEVQTSARSKADLRAISKMKPSKISVDDTVTINCLKRMVWIYEVDAPFKEFAKRLDSDFGDRMRWFDQYQALTKDFPGGRTMITVKMGVLRKLPSPNRGTDYVQKDDWVTLTLTDTPDLLNPPSVWPKEASNATIADPKPPLSLCANRSPVKERRWFASGGSGTDYTYVFTIPAKELEDRLRLTIRAPWGEPSRPSQCAYEIWDQHKRSPDPYKLDEWPWWGVRVSAVEGRSDRSLLIVTRGRSLNPRR